MTAPRCADCGNWDSRDGLVGYCEEITALFRILADVAVSGLALCRTAQSGSCRLFVLSDQAQDEDASEEHHRNALRRAAGRDYPASLEPGPTRSLQWPS